MKKVTQPVEDKSTQDHELSLNPINEPNELSLDGNKVEPDSTVELSEVDKLITKRTGYWPIDLDESELRWLRNHIRDKFEFTGPSEAFMVMNTYLGLVTALDRLAKGGPDHELVIQAATIEGCAHFINTYTTKGLDNAQNMFKIAMALNPIIIDMQALDKQIEELQQADVAPTLRSIQPDKVEISKVTNDNDV